MRIKLDRSRDLEFVVDFLTFRTPLTRREAIQVAVGAADVPDCARNEPRLQRLGEFFSCAGTPPAPGTRRERRIQRMKEQGK